MICQKLDFYEVKLGDMKWNWWILLNKTNPLKRLIVVKWRHHYCGILLNHLSILIRTENDKWTTAFWKIFQKSNSWPNEKVHFCLTVTEFTHIKKLNHDIWNEISNFSILFSSILLWNFLQQTTISSCPMDKGFLTASNAQRS